ncbi:MAG: hypothetical protein ABH828_01050 [archaeon]
MLSPFEIITTTNKIILVKGKVIYNDRKRKIDLKRPIRDLFDATSNNVHYMMELCLSKEEAIKRVTQLTEKEVIPIIMYFIQTKEET